MKIPEELQCFIDDTEKILLALQKKYSPRNAENFKKILNILTACIFSLITDGVKDSNQVEAIDKIFTFIKQTVEEENSKKTKVLE
jgi:hypothetical protein